MDKLRGYLPVLAWGPKITRQTFVADLIAGLCVGLMVTPQALAYAEIAKLDRQFGLYSSYIGVWMYCLFGTAKDVTLGPTAVLCLLIAEAADGDPVLAVTLAFLVGIFQLLIGFLKLGALARRFDSLVPCLGALCDLISYPVLSGFTSASATIIGLRSFR